MSLIYFNGEWMNERQRWMTARNEWETENTDYYYSFFAPAHLYLFCSYKT